MITSYLGSVDNPNSGDPNFFTSLSAWQAAFAATMSDDHELLVYDDFGVEGYQVWGFSYSGWAVNDGQYEVTIRPVPGQESLGRLDVGAAFGSNLGSSPFAIILPDQNYCHIEGMRFYYTGNIMMIYSNTTQHVGSSITRCTLQHRITGTNNFCRCIVMETVNDQMRIEANLITLRTATDRPAISVSTASTVQQIIRNNLVEYVSPGNGPCYGSLGPGAFNPSFENNVALGNNSQIGMTQVNNSTNNGFEAGCLDPFGNVQILDISRTPGTDFVDANAGDFSIASETSRLYNSGTPNNLGVGINGVPFSNNDIGPFAFDAGGDVEISFDGNIADITGTQGQAITPVDVSPQYSGDLTPFTFTSVGTALPAGLTISSAGVISGTPTAAGTTSGHIVRGEDTGANTADSNGFAIVIDPATVSLNPAALRHPQRIQQAVLSQAHKISAADIRHLQRIEQTALIVTEINTISPADIRQDQRLQQAILQQLHTLQPADIRQAQRLQGALVFIPGTPIFPNDIRHGQRIDAAVIDVSNAIQPATIRHSQRVEQAALDLTRTVQPADIRQNQRLQQASFAGFVVGGLSGKILAYVLLDGSIVVNPDFNQH